MNIELTYARWLIDNMHYWLVSVKLWCFLFFSMFPLFGVRVM